MLPPSEMSAAHEAPVRDRAARDVAGAEHEVGAVLGGRDQPRDVGRVVREVAVHLEHELGAVGERAAEAGDVGGAEALLAPRWRTPTKASSAASRSASSPVPSGEASSITSTRSPSRSTVAERAHHRLEVLELVVGREADGRAHRRRRAYDRLTWRAERLPRNDELAAQFELLADLMELEGADGFRIAAYRRAAARIRETGSSVAQLALDGRAKELQGIGKTIEQKIVEVVEDGEIHALTKRKAEVPEEVATLHAPARARPEDGPPDLEGARDHDRRRAARGRRGGAAPRPRRARRRDRRRRSSRRSRKPRGGRGPAARAARHDAAEAARGRRGARGASGRRSGLDRRLGPPLPRDGARPRPDRDRDRPAGAPRRVLRAAAGWSRSPPRGHEGDRDRPGRPPLRPPRRPAGGLRQPAPALHRLEGPQRRAARGGGAARALGLRVRRSPRSRPARCTRSRPRRRSTRFLGYAWIPPELRENGGELEAAARTASCRSSSSSATCAATSTRTRPGRTARTRSRRWSPRRSHRGYDYYAICDHSHRLRDGRLEQQAEAIDALERAGRPIRLLKGIEVNIRADGDARRRRRGARDARLGRRLGAQRASTTTRPGACSRRWRTRTSTASAT